MENSTEALASKVMIDGIKIFSVFSERLFEHPPWLVEFYEILASGEKTRLHHFEHPRWLVDYIVDIGFRQKNTS